MTSGVPHCSTLLQWWWHKSSVRYEPGMRWCREDEVGISFPHPCTLGRQRLPLGLTAAGANRTGGQLQLAFPRRRQCGLAPGSIKCSPDPTSWHAILREWFGNSKETCFPLHPHLCCITESRPSVGAHPDPLHCMLKPPHSSVSTRGQRRLPRSIIRLGNEKSSIATPPRMRPARFSCRSESPTSNKHGIISKP